MNINDILDARILIVDDQAGQRQLLTRLLGHAGYTPRQLTMKPQEVCACIAITLRPDPAGPADAGDGRLCR
jgi:PleD family two-component response regulator